MFGVSSGELIIILLLVLIMVKPEDLPAFMRKAGQIVGMLRGYHRELIVKGVEFKQELEAMADVSPAPASPAASPSPALPQTSAPVVTPAEPTPVAVAAKSPEPPAPG